MPSLTRYCIALLLLFHLSLGAQEPAKPEASKPEPAKAEPAKTEPAKPAAPLSSEYLTKSFDLHFADPEQIRDLFSGRSFVMEVNRDLKVLTVHGSPVLIKEVEDTIKRFDVPPPASANIQITVYLLTTAAQAPAGVAVPADLSALSKEFGKPAPKLADTQSLRVREGQAGQVTGLSSKPESASLSRIWLQSAQVTPGPKGDRVSLYGLRVWLSIPAPGSNSAGSQLRADPDLSADIDIDQNQPVMVAKTGMEEPVLVAVRATVIR